MGQSERRFLAPIWYATLLNSEGTVICAFDLGSFSNISSMPAIARRPGQHRSGGDQFLSSEGRVTVVIPEPANYLLISYTAKR